MICRLAVAAGVVGEGAAGRTRSGTHTQAKTLRQDQSQTKNFNFQDRRKIINMKNFTIGMIS